MPEDDKDPQPSTAAPAEAKPKKASSPWIPVLAVVIACPLLSFVVIQFLVFPRLEKTITDMVIQIQQTKASGEGGDALKLFKKAPHPKKEDKKDEGEEGEGNSYEFKGIVANIAGALQSRYIKVSFTLEGDDPDLNHRVAEDKAKIVDATLGILSALTLNDLEQPGIKNVVRSDLLGAYESIFHERLVKELYFSEFVVQ